MKSVMLQQFDEYLEKQDVLNKLTEKQKLNEYGYSEIHTICLIKTLDDPNVTEVSKSLKMTRGAISKIMQKLQNKGLIEAYRKSDNRQKIFYKLTVAGEELFEAHESRHNMWIIRDSKFFEQFDNELLSQVNIFMTKYNEYLKSQIEELSKENSLL